MQEVENNSQATAMRRRKKIVIISATVSGVILAVCLGMFGWLTHGRIEPSYVKSAVSVDQELRVSLNQRLLRIPLDHITVTPEVEGEWTLERSLLDGDALVFVPKHALVADTTYVVKFNGVKRVTGLGVELPEVTFTTEAAPGVEGVTFEDGAILASDAAFSMSLSAANRGLRRLELRTKPAIETTLAVKDDRHFTWTPKQRLPQGKTVAVTIVDRVSEEILVEREVVVAAEPKLVSRPQETNFGKDDQVKLVFSRPINPDSGTLEFDLKGEGEWKDDKTYVFTPEAVAPGATYHYTIPKNLRSKEGGVVAKAKEYTFSTPGVVRAVAFSPHGQELSQARQTVQVTFNQPVDKKSAEQRVSVSRGTIQGRSWSGNTLMLTMVDMGAQRTVTIAVKAGVKPIFGLASTQQFGHSFTTEIPTKKLNVPMYYQQYAQSCESASLRMALAYKGKSIGSDMTILKQIGYDPRPLKKGVWDDPEQQFVGDVHGNQGKGTGWGVYAQPVAKAARYFGRQASVQYGVTASFVAQNVHKGNPVILWGIWDESAAQKSWKTPEGKKVSGPIPMHVRLVVGVKGRADNPVGFYIHDPITGPMYWTADYMVYNAQRAGAANMAVAVQ